MIINPSSEEAYKLFHDGALALARCEQHGMRVDERYVQEQQKLLKEKINSLEREFAKTDFYKQWKAYNKGTLNIYSDKQLSEFIYKKLRHKVEKTTEKGNASVDIEALQDLNIPDLQPYLKIGKFRTLKNTFIKGLERETVDGVMHPFFHLHIPVTYRGSSSDPNFQNMPKRDEEQMNIIRGAILPSKGFQLMELDYSQLEVRIAAAYHKDPTMLTYINDKTTDMHRDMAQQIFIIKKYKPDDKTYSNLRNATKNGFVFPAFYGDYHVGFAKSLSSFKWLGLPKNEKWKETDGCKFKDATIAKHLIKHGIDHLGLPVPKEGERYGAATGFTKHLQDIENHFWNKRFPVYNKWKEEWYQQYLKDGYFYNKTGFTFKGVMNKKDCINYPVQSSAFHVLLWSLIQANEEMIAKKWKTRIIGQIHDAIVFDLYPSEKEMVIETMKRIMTYEVRKHWSWINVPLEVECELCPIDAPWSKKEKYNIH